MHREERFNEVFKKHSTDKYEHGYAEMYAEFMPENPKVIIEIGVKEGNSMRAWKELFPNAWLIGVDLFQEFPIPIIEGVKFLSGNQCDWRLLDLLRGFNADVIIDDGSHNARDQMISFYGLAHAGCNYFIEDVHCNNEEFYSQGLPANFRANMNWSMYNIQHMGTPQYHHFINENKQRSSIIHIQC